MQTVSVTATSRVSSEHLASLGRIPVTMIAERVRNSARLRLWPGVLIVAVQLLLRFALPAVYEDGLLISVGAGVVGMVLVFVWWAFFSRAPVADRWGILLWAVVAMAAARLLLLDPSLAKGMMGLLFFIYAPPFISLALVGSAVLARNLPHMQRRAAMAGAILAACAGFGLLRTDGITGAGHSQFAWRWSKSAEEQLLAKLPQIEAAAPPTGVNPQPVPAEPPSAKATEPVPTPAPVPVETKPISVPDNSPWPGFRGPGRDSVVRGSRIRTDWNVSAPVELWRRPVGPGWSSFAVGDGVFYTQEQRGESEVVSCYNAVTGEPVWTHRDAARFWESNAGAGPRGTPALHGGRVYALGATGILNALDARTGSVVWKTNAAADTGAKTPGWGFAGSPRVVGDLLVAAVSGRLAAYELETGKRRWLGPEGGGVTYSSPHARTLAGVPQILLIGGRGVSSVSPTDGVLLWKHDLPGNAILQPAVTPDGDLLLTAGDSGGATGTRRIRVRREGSRWTTGEVWATTGLKPYYNDLVIHAGYAYGFDGSILACIDLQDGTRKWKGGRYGHGQMLLLRDQDLLLVLSEEGELALVSATPGQFTEVARIKAIEGKTWNHPVIVGDLLLVRNGEEMVAYRLPLASS